MFVVVFQGAESVTHRDTLESIRDLFEEPPHLAVGISYKSLMSRRLTASYVTETHDRGFSVILEGGVSGSSLTADEASRMAGEYYEFVESLPPHIVAVQFDHPAADGIDIHGIDRVLPIWQGGDPKVLSEMLREKGSVALSYDGDTRVPAILRRDSEDHSVMLALGQADLATAKKAGFNMAMTNAWTAPAKYGEVSVWDGSKFHRVSSADKARLLSKHASYIGRAGLDLDLLDRGDARELNRLAAFSFLRWAEALDTSTKSEESEGAEVVTLRSVSTKRATSPVKKTRTATPLPIFDTDEVEGVEQEEDGSTQMRSRSVLRTSSETIRVCDSCFLASTCPAYEPGSSCAFNFPIEVRTDTQVKSLLNSILELQATRIAFARFAEEVNGGQPDPVVGQEMDRLFRMAEKLKKVEEKRERLSVTLESESSGGGTGVLSAIFGERAQLPSTDSDVIIADVVDDD